MCVIIVWCIPVFICCCHVVVSYMFLLWFVLMIVSSVFSYVVVLCVFSYVFSPMLVFRLVFICCFHMWYVCVSMCFPKRIPDVVFICRHHMFRACVFFLCVFSYVVFRCAHMCSYVFFIHMSCPMCFHMMFHMRFTYSVGLCFFPMFSFLRCFLIFVF